MRCITLAEGLRESGVKVKFICRALPGNLIDVVIVKNFEVLVMQNFVSNIHVSEKQGNETSILNESEDIQQTIGLLSQEKPDWLIKDHYGLNIFWEQSIRLHVKKLMVIDDHFEKKHSCNILLNQNYRHKFDIKKIESNETDCKFLIGPSYALLNKNYLHIREFSISHRAELNRILVFYTLGDDRGETLKALNAIELFGNEIKVDVVVGGNTKFLIDIYNKCNRLGWSYYYQIDFMPQLIAKADLVIGSAGASSWERCALGAPAIVSIMAENQIAIAESLALLGAIENLGWFDSINTEHYINALSEINPQKLKVMSKASLEVVDAKGVIRVVNELMMV